MATAETESFDHQRRSASGCLCCGNSDLVFETQIVSGFLAARAWGGPPQTTQLVSCETCGFRFFDRGLSRAETARYYRGYRNADYVRARWRWEPFYTQGQHMRQVEWSRATLRTDALCEALAQSSAPSHFASALDHGGNEGHMLAGVSADRKAVFDPSGAATLPGIVRYVDIASMPGEWQLVLSCQVLEHVSSPTDYLRELGALIGDSGWLYVEVPLEIWRPASGAGTLRDAWLRLLTHSRPLLMVADGICTASRIKLGRLPPLGFVAMREHLNYFNVGALVALFDNNGFAVDASGINAAGQIFVIARKSVTVCKSNDKTAGAAA